MTRGSSGALSAVIGLTLAPGCGAKSGLAADNALAPDDSLTADNGRGGRNSAAGDGGPAPPSWPAVCTDPAIDDEPGILEGYGPGQSVEQSGQIKVWVCDENSPFIAPGEMVENTTGAITAPGDRTATAADGLLDEPALYIAPQSPTNGGTPYFPQWIKGSYNNTPPTPGTFAGGAPVDQSPAMNFRGFDAGDYLSEPGLRGRDPCLYRAEFVWDVSTLGVVPGTYTVVFSVHDGDGDRGIGCATIVITQ